MKLLVLIHRLPCPPDRGAKLRAALELRWLARRYDVWCAGFLDTSGFRRPDSMVRDSLAELRSMCRGVQAVPLRRPIAGLRALGRLMTGGTCTEGYFDSLQLRNRVMRWSREIGFDAVLAFSSSMAPLALQVPAKRHVLDLVDLDSQKWAESVKYAYWPMTWIYRTETHRLARREREWIAAFDASVLVNHREAKLLSKEQSLRNHVHVIEMGDIIGVEPPSGHPSNERGEHLAAMPSEPMIGFFGAMDYPPNIDGVCWFADSIWPIIQRSRPDVNWWIVGRSPKRAVRKLDDGRRVHVTGTVPAIEPYLACMQVCVAPLRLARGVQTKVLMAMKARRPCVVTPCVAEGIGAQPDRELIVADTPVSFADAILDLLIDQPRAEAIGKAAQEFVARRFRNTDGLERLGRLLLGSL